MAHKTSELKFNQGKEEMDLWLSGIGFWGSSNYRLHKWICEYNIDNRGCAMAGYSSRLFLMFSRAISFSWLL